MRSTPCAPGAPALPARWRKAGRRGYKRRVPECHLHLISDSTGETANAVARAALAQFESVQPVEHSWALVRTPRQVDRVLAAIRRNPGIVLYTLVEPGLSAALERGCRELGVACIDVLGRVLAGFARALGAEGGHSPGRQHLLDDEYYRRIDAMQFVLAHDDGQSLDGIGAADVIVVGVSRVSKSPTCMYLANRGVKAANVPWVAGAPFPEDRIARAGPLAVGLTASPDRIVQLRRNRLRGLGDGNNPYADPRAVRAEVAEARKLFARRGWPVIDVSRRSIEETAAAILQCLRDRQEAAET